MKLKELAVLHTGVTAPKETGDVPVYGSGGIIGSTNKASAEGPAVIIGRKGSIEKVWYCEGRFWASGTVYWAEAKNVLPKYLYYMLKNADLWQYDEGAVIPSLRMASLYELEFDVPCAEEQKRILERIEYCEEMIDVNRKIIENMENQIKALI